MDSSSSCCVFNVEEEVVVIRNGWTPKKEECMFDMYVYHFCLQQYVCFRAVLFATSCLNFIVFVTFVNFDFVRNGTYVDQVFLVLLGAY